MERLTDNEEKIIELLEERHFEKSDILGVLLIASEDNNHKEIIGWLKAHPQANAEELFVAIA